MLIWIIVLSLGYFGFKGGIFTIFTGGVDRVWGPPDTFVEGNNELALALLMILPLMQYLRTTSDRKWVRHGLLTAMVLCAFSIVGSQSRGALVGGLAMAGFLWLKSKRKLVTGVALIVFIPLLFIFMPQSWHDRMSTIETYEEDGSAMARINTWKMALALANDKVIGGGFELWKEDTFERYAPGLHNNDAHSIYFKVLAEHGWIGLMLFLGIGLMTWRTATWIIRQAKDRAELAWLAELSRSIQVSLAAYAGGGAFLGLSYFDLYWHLVAMVVIGKVLMQQYQAGSPISVTDRRSVAPQYRGVFANQRQRGNQSAES